jgi:hypothetical protein
MENLDVLREIVEWSQSRPEWQRDALRRLVTQGDLEGSDLEELIALCKGTHGLAVRRESVPLEECHIPSHGVGPDVVKLTALIHHDGVNALAKDQMIEFGPALTIVYGANAAGKSGFTRILKRACRARGAEEILGNVLVEAGPTRPSATVRFEVAGRALELSWNDYETHEALGHVSVFDSHSAAVYVREKTDVAFRPFGLDLFDRLSDACEVVRKALEKERRELENVHVNVPVLHEGTAAHRFVSGITSLTDPKDVGKLGTLSEAEKKRLKEVRKQRADLQAEDPKKTARTLTLRARRLDTLGAHLKKLDEVLSDRVVQQVFEARDIVHKARVAAEAVRTTTFPPDLLTGTGLDLWRGLWEAARRFSTEHAYPDLEFPVVGEGTLCVLCQQGLKDPASERLKRFEEGVRSTVQQELDRVRMMYEEHFARVESVIVRGEGSTEALEELRIEAEELAESVEDCLEQAQLRQERALKALRDDLPGPAELPRYESQAPTVSAEAGVLRDRAEQVLRNSDHEARTRLSNELQELEARETLGSNLSAVLEEIERKKRLAAYQVCLQDTTTTGITRKSTEVTTRAVTQQLGTSFRAELERLRFTHLEVALQAAGGARGTLYHKLVLKRAPGVELPRVLSEGEARCLSIAAFFAELSTASDQSTILFDDPVSSLDHAWRENVARRLAEEAETRQVVVFTHDIVFLLALVRFADEVGAPCQHQHLRREAFGTGVSSLELPWVAMKVRDRLGVLRSMWQRAEKLYRTACRDDYEREAILIYGRLREAWERGLEEILLGGVVERYRPSVQTQQAKHLSDITDGDCNALEAGMTKCSRWLPGHDQAPAEGVALPDPNELKADIEALDTWVKTILRRRK